MFWEGMQHTQTLSATNRAGLSLYYAKSTKCTVAANTHSHRALLSYWQSSLGQAAASGGPCCSKDMWL